MREIYIAVFSSLLISLPSSAHSDVIDLTALLLSKSDLQKKLDANCEKFAAGNQRECKLVRATLETVGSANVIRVTADASIRSRHRTGGVTIYSHTTKVSGVASISAVNCDIVEFDIKADNDIAKAIVDVFKADVQRDLEKALSFCR